MITSKNNFPFALHKYYGYKIFDTLSKKKKLLIVLLASSITPSLPPSLRGFYFRVIMKWTLPSPIVPCRVRVHEVTK